MLPASAGKSCPPGIKLLVAKIPAFAAIFVCVSCALHAVRKLFQLEKHFSLFASTPIALFLVAIVSVARLIFEKVKNRWDAAALGAVLPPTVDGRLPGNLDIFFQALKGDKSGYIGEHVGLLSLNFSDDKLRRLLG